MCAKPHRLNAIHSSSIFLRRFPPGRAHRPVYRNRDCKPGAYKSARYFKPALVAYTFVIQPQPPFRLDLTVWALRRRPENRIDLWDGRVYRRVAILDGAPVMLSVVQTEPGEAAQLLVSLSGETARPSLQVTATAFLEKTLGLQMDLTDFYNLSRTDNRLGPMVQRFRGLKPPRFPPSSNAW